MIWDAMKLSNHTGLIFHLMKGVEDADDNLLSIVNGGVGV